ncbi:cytochrome c oxidase subunit 2A [Cohnella pontilimi]|uniref:Cytochrome c oxidase subunit 2A n=1 Tax=Cohnella pontilimi TaxID=2564100 RepID=A0A4U0F921_9BACL|nr:cytochrome c oxidase subunit 2A [Cohnella pontilimi]TJY41141.1 cytochrome c oxidase subunit 2A [Cohnella pontilimi]
MSDFRPQLGQQTPIPQEQKKQEPVLKGTFAAVLLLGAFIAISWIGVFLIFMTRN